MLLETFLDSNDFLLLLLLMLYSWQELLLPGSTGSKKSHWSGLNVIDSWLIQSPPKFCSSFQTLSMGFWLDGDQQQIVRIWESTLYFIMIPEQKKGAYH